MNWIVQPVILAGGSGTRLWPLSRATYPKQFLALSGESTLFQLATQRLKTLPGVNRSPTIVGNSEHRFMALEQLREIGVRDPSIILEPTGRNTAPAVTLAALSCRDSGDDPIMVVTPADQTVTNEHAFADALTTACEQASKNHIVILGITPTQPETGFGYIHSPGSEEIRAVQSFCEKPDAETAAKYLLNGGYFWNGGIFVVKASVWLQSIGKARPDILQACEQAWAAKKQDGAFVRPGATEFAAVPSESVDYAVLEKCEELGIPLSMVPMDAGWSDLGAWDAVWQVASKDAAGNATQGDVLVADSHDSLVRANHRLVTLVGLDNVVVIETTDAVLVASKDRAQDVKRIVGQLQGQGRHEHHQHRRVNRPWGWYDSIDQGERFQVKRILVNPGASLSLQMHHHRAEHWIVVSGTAEVTVGDKVVLLTENQSTYIPLGQTHRLRNPGKLQLELIEVQSGSYLGEDDIVRFEDHYGRT